MRDHIQKEQTFLRDIILVSVPGIFFVSLMIDLKIDRTVRRTAMMQTTHTQLKIE